MGAYVEETTRTRKKKKKRDWWWWWWCELYVGSLAFQDCQNWITPKTCKHSRPYSVYPSG